MSIINKMHRGAVRLLAALFGLSILIPIASAVTSPTFLNVTISPTPFFSNVPGQSAKLNIDYDYSTGGFATGPVIEQIKDANSNVVYEFGMVGADTKANGHYQLQWDGKCNVTITACTSGDYVPDGQYTVYLYSRPSSPPAATYNSVPFDVAQTKAPVVALAGQPSGVYYKGTGNYSVNYNLTRNSGNAWTVRLKIKSLSNSDEVVIAEPKTTDGAMTISWDGKINGLDPQVGSYTWELWADATVNSYSVASNLLAGNFAVSNPNVPTATVSGLTTNPNPFDPTNGSVNLSYTLSNSSGAASINASVYSSTNLNTALKSWAFNNQANGTNTLTWDGKDAVGSRVPDGGYVFKVGGFDGYSVITMQETNFTVSTIPPANNCAGFSDVSPTDPDCPGITYMKTLGAMTGNPDGTFAPQDLLQRDQIMKIVLETFKKFDKQQDYCNGSRPFPDVAESDWAFQYICQAKQLGITTGYQAGPDTGFYRPARSVNRIEFLALVLRNLTNETMPSNDVGSYADVALNQWFTGYAKYAYDNNLFNHPNLFPTNFMVRVEVARVIYKLHQLGKI